MIIQDALTGRLHEIPDQLYRSHLGEYGQLYEPQWGEYPQGYGYSPQRVASQVLYDGLGNPVGLFPLLAALAPLAAKILPQIAQKVLPKVAQRFLPMISQALPAISSFFQGAPMPDQQVAPPPGAPIPTSMPGLIHPPAPPVMGPMVHPMMRSHRRRRCRCVKVIRRHMEPIREAGNAEPANAVQGWGYYRGFNGYGRW
ncbi:MAG TPA: hypothetical protein VE715_15785 [Blastocatellia bacterium]|nr:hypothetical protein [Blastocatellia bacterium]